MIMKTMILHNQCFDATTHQFSIQLVNERGAPCGVVCLFDVPPDPGDDYQKEHAAARAIFNAVNCHDDLLAALKALEGAYRDIELALPADQSMAIVAAWAKAASALAKAEGRS